MARADVTLTAPSQSGSMFDGAGIRQPIQTPAGVYYCVYIDNAADVAFKKSTDGGITWSIPTVVFIGSTTALSVCYDRDSGIAAGKIHCAYIESGGDDVLYRSIDTEAADALSTQTTIFAGTATGNGSALSISRARGGNLGCVFNINAGTQDGFAKSTDVGATWSPAADPTEATSDYWILLPGHAADNQDFMMFFWDRSADEISRKLYDDSLDSWAETSIATGMVDVSGGTSFPHFAAAVDLANSRNLLVAWTGVDTANADLRCWHITESAITEVTNVVLNSVDDQGLCAVGIDKNTEDWYVFYGGKSDGSETMDTAINIYFKRSTDDGATWSAEKLLTGQAYGIDWLVCTQRFDSEFLVEWLAQSPSAADELRVSALLPLSARARSIVGVM